MVHSMVHPCRNSRRHSISLHECDDFLALQWSIAAQAACGGDRTWFAFRLADELPRDSRVEVSAANVPSAEGCAGCLAWVGRRVGRNITWSSVWYFPRPSLIEEPAPKHNAIRPLTTPSVSYAFNTYPPFSIARGLPDTEMSGNETQPGASWTVIFNNHIAQDTIDKVPAFVVVVVVVVCVCGGGVWGGGSRVSQPKPRSFMSSLGL